MDNLLMNLKSKGFKITEQRKVIIKSIMEKHASVAPFMIWEEVRKRNPNISLDTVYRCFDILSSLGYLCKVTGPGKKSEYEVTKEKHVHYMICANCGAREVFSGCGFDGHDVCTKVEKGYEILSHKLEVYVLCPKCNEKKGDTQ